MGIFPTHWVAEADDNGLGEFTIRDEDGGYIADVRNPYVDYDQQVAYANSPDCQLEGYAKLLAAAPDLLQALRVANTLLGNIPAAKNDPDVIQAITVNRRAIARVDGALKTEA